MSSARGFKGVVHGRIIELDRDANLPDGQAVIVIVRPSDVENRLSGEGIRRSFGGWADELDDLDRFIDWNRQQRKRTRPEPRQ